MPHGCASVDCQLTEAAAARGLRRLEQLSGQSALAAGCGGGQLELARCAAAMLELERLASTRDGRRVELAGLLSRVATLVQLATPGGSTMITSVAGADVAAGLARAVVAVTLDLIQVVAPRSGGGVRPVMMLATSVDHQGLLVTVAGPPGAEAPDAVAARCLERANRIARSVGGVATRGVDCGRHVAALACPLPDWSSTP